MLLDERPREGHGHARQLKKKPAIRNYSDKVEDASPKSETNRGPASQMRLMPQTCIPVNPCRSTKPISLEMEPTMPWQKGMKGKTKFKAETFKTAQRVSSQISTSIPDVSPFEKTFSTTDKILSTPLKTLFAAQKTFCTLDLILFTVDKVLRRTLNRCSGTFRRQIPTGGTAESPRQPDRFL
jgi:hypothetical protein